MRKILLTLILTILFQFGKSQTILGVDVSNLNSNPDTAFKLTDEVYTLDTTNYKVYRKYERWGVVSFYPGLGYYFFLIADDVPGFQVFMQHLIGVLGDPKMTYVDAGFKINFMWEPFDNHKIIYVIPHDCKAQIYVLIEKGSN